MTNFFLRDMTCSWSISRRLSCRTLNMYKISSRCSLNWEFVFYISRRYTSGNGNSDERSDNGINDSGKKEKNKKKPFIIKLYNTDSHSIPKYRVPEYQIGYYGTDLCTIPFCSLERLVYDIGVGYSELSDLFPELTMSNVRSIQKRILMGTYRLSVLRLNAFTDNKDLKPPTYNHIIHIERGERIYLAFSSPPEDRLVLMALGRMINLTILENNYILENSYGMKVDWYYYYDKIVCGREKVLRLYKIDLSNSIFLIHIYVLLCKLYDIVMDGDIMDLLDSFFHLPVQDDTGLDLGSDNIFMKIPSVALLTDVLFYFALSELDFWLKRLFQQLDCTRFLHEIIVTFPSSKEPKMSFEKFEELLVIVLDNCKLSGNIISIGPGDPPVPCYGGHICVSQEGLIQVQKKKQE